MKTKPTVLIGVVLLVVGIVFLILENTFYQYLSDDGVLHESLFLPLGTLSLFFGMAIFVFLGIKLFYHGILRR